MAQTLFPSRPLLGMYAARMRNHIFHLQRYILNVFMNTDGRGWVVWVIDLEARERVQPRHEPKMVEEPPPAGRIYSKVAIGARMGS